MNRIIGVGFIVVSSIAFGAMAIFAKWAYQAGVSPISALFLRFTLAGIFMLTVMFLRKIPFPRGKTLFGLFLMGFIGYTGQSFSYFTALTLAPAGMVAILLYLYPVLVTILSLIFLKHRMTRLDVIALLLALIGTALVIGMEIGGKPLGIAFGIAAALIYSIYIIAGTNITRHTDAFAASTVIILSTSLSYGILGIAQGIHLPTTPVGWGAVTAIALISTVVAIVTFFAGLKRIGPVNASMLSTLEPVVTVALSSLIFGETITASKIIGGAMILVTAILLAQRETTRNNQHEN